MDVPPLPDTVIFCHYNNNLVKNMCFLKYAVYNILPSHENLYRQQGRHPLSMPRIWFVVDLRPGAMPQFRGVRRRGNFSDLGQPMKGMRISNLCHGEYHALTRSAQGRPNSISGMKAMFRRSEFTSR